MLKSEELRLKFSELGFTYQMITSKEIGKLIQLLNIEIDIFNKNPDNELKLNISKFGNNDFNYDYNNDGAIKSVFIKVDAFYFEDREAISFNSNGFIGFCGWSSSVNSVPFYNAFDRWLEYLKNN